MTTKAQLAQYCADHFPPVTHIVHTGIPMLYSIIAVVVSLAAGFGIGWYVKGRGLTGVAIDANNVKAEAEKVTTEAVAEVKTL